MNAYRRRLTKCLVPLKTRSSYLVKEFVVMLHWLWCREDGAHTPNSNCNSISAHQDLDILLAARKSGRWGLSYNKAIVCIAYTLQSLLFAWLMVFALITQTLMMIVQIITCTMSVVTYPSLSSSPGVVHSFHHCVS